MLRAASGIFPLMVRTAVGSHVRKLVSRPAALTLVRTMTEKVEQLNEFQKSKLKRKFFLYDIDDDGFVEREDYDNYIAKIKEAYDLSDDDPLLKAFEVEFESHWQQMLNFMDENADGQLSLEEWLHYYPNITANVHAKNQDNLPTFLLTMADTLFDLMDTKKDGVIDAEEYSEFWTKFDRRYPVDVATAKEHLAHLTENGKYDMDIYHYRAVYADYTWSDDPDTFGRYAYGPIVL
ncbi:sarcoplasmic calcium-binding protein, beta chain [Lingula anatina]|uniref:Sarcoplasmic calcium-binding protein, beta chain n=1 Tax=Lingula anatina TaxID=7574 RepID=A0A2R2MI72_LINAN|nr:sarcoplasmic calcium-binding protein, beta chain [Lingula anatina]|eukprot:XP_023929911.1 sarcoplasmic calcium-binding protein, beta chain [Lingula anatina]